MSIELTADKSYTIQHDLNFAQTRYESKHVLVSFDFEIPPFERKYGVLINGTFSFCRYRLSRTPSLL